MEDLFERETAILLRAKNFLDQLPDSSSDYYQEFNTIMTEYEFLLRQAKLLIRCSDLTATGLNADKMDLMNKVNIDDLTNIYNRRFLEENLKRYLNLLARTDGQLSLLMLDLDFFKNYNDNYGHTAGDFCLKKVASTIQASISRAGDFVARYGGEEFLVVLSGTGREGAMHVAQKILENVRQLQIPHKMSGVSNCVTVSIGVTSSAALLERNAQKYIARADAALYHSKRTGRNRITYFPFEEEAK